MAKKKITHKTVSHGIYRDWDRDSKDLPVIVEFTDTIPTRIGIEFGYILNIINGKGRKLIYSIEHPPFADDSGAIAPPFTGELYVRSNDWSFFLGDTIWEPAHDKIGAWRLLTMIDDLVLEDRTFTMIPDAGEAADE